MTRRVSIMTIVSIKQAKDNLTRLRREAITGKEIILSDAKRKDEPDASLISTALLDELCETMKFTYKWPDNPDKKTGLYSIWNNETNIYGTGPTKADAMNDFIDNILDYTQAFFDDLPYYLSKNNPNRSHYWYLRRVARFSEDRDKLVQTLELPEAN